MQDQSGSNQLKNDVFDWAFSLVACRLQKEVVVLSQRQNGLHFNVTQAESAFMDNSFMQQAAQKMQAISPHLWRLIQRLLDAKGNSDGVPTTDGNDLGDKGGHGREEMGEMEDVALKGIGISVDDNGSDSAAESDLEVAGTTPSGRALVLQGHIKPNQERKRHNTAERAALRRAQIITVVCHSTPEFFFGAHFIRNL